MPLQVALSGHGHTAEAVVGSIQIGENPTRSMNTDSNTATDPLAEVLQRYWGYDDFLPLQKDAMQCVLANQDSVVVLPTAPRSSNAPS